MAFNGDHLIWIEFTNLINKYNVNVIVETGTYKAQSTVDFATLGLVVHTTESRVPFYNEALSAIQSVKNPELIFPHFGDSPKILEEIIPPLAGSGQRIIFFLDAHWYNDNCLERELNVLANIDFQDVMPIILIHDIKVPDHPEYGFDLYKDRPISLEWIGPILDRIYGVANFKHWYNTGISEKATHNRGCVFIVPHLTK